MINAFTGYILPWSGEFPTLIFAFSFDMIADARIGRLSEEGVCFFFWLDPPRIDLLAELFLLSECLRGAELWRLGDEYAPPDSE